MLLPRLWRWQTTLGYEMLSLLNTLWVLLSEICLYGLKNGREIHSFIPSWYCLIAKVLATWVKLLEPSGYCANQLHLHLLHNKCFWLLPWHYSLVWTISCQIRLHFTFICAAFKSHIMKQFMSPHQLTQYYQPESIYQWRQSLDAFIKQVFKLIILGKFPCLKLNM